MTPEPEKSIEELQALQKAKNVLLAVSDALGGGDIGSFSVVAKLPDGTEVQETHVEPTKDE